MKPRIIAHGGAWRWDDSRDAEKSAGMQDAIGIGQAVLDNGGSALDAVERTVEALENNPAFDAGTGGYLNASGEVQLDALFCDGRTIDFGAVAATTRLRNPVRVARKVMESTPYKFLVGPGAEAMAKELGFALIDNDVLVTQRMREFARQMNVAGHDTVGAIAIDKNGHTASATSTSGSAGKPDGRVGDSPLFGSGGYADDRYGAAGATGLGEHIMRLLLSKYAVDLLAQGMSAPDAAKLAIAFADARFANSMCGIIVVDRNGDFGMAHSTPKMAVGWGERDTAARGKIMR